MFENCPSGINPEFVQFLSLSFLYFAAPSEKCCIKLYFNKIDIKYLSSNFFKSYFQHLQLSKAESIEKKSVIRIVNSELKCDFLWNFEPIVFDAHLTLNPIKANH